MMVIGDSRPYLCAIIVLNSEQWKALAKTLTLDPDDAAALKSEVLEKTVLDRLARRLGEFPGYAQVRRVVCIQEPWSVDNGLITPTMKLKRDCILMRYADEITALYAGH
jgi:long-chain acyl-CoA synthetase